MTPQSLPKAAARGGSVGNYRPAGVDKASALRAPRSLGSALAALPSDLAAWLRVTSTRDAAAGLAVSEGRVRQLRTGSGRAVSPEILRRWAVHQARDKLPAQPWEVRKVDADGVVWLRGRRYASEALAVFAGRQVVVALLACGSVLVQPIALGGGVVAAEVMEEP